MIAALIACIFVALPPAPRVRDPGPVRWLIGQTHVHTALSGDSRTRPADVIRWYTMHGFDFIVVTDHNQVVRVNSDGPLLVVPGTELTQNPPSCDPAPPEPGGKCRIHVNALFVDPAASPEIPWPRPATSSRRRVDLYQRAIDASRTLGGLVQLNHPTWHHGVDAPLLVELCRRGVGLVEVANQGFARENLGTDRHPSTEALWDAALSFGVRVWGVASDDAHHYWDIDERLRRGDKVYQAHKGFVVVRARKSAGSIRDAMERGDFYASTGVYLDRVDVGRDALALEVSPRSPGPHRFVFIGRDGRPLAESEGRSARFRLSGAAGGYVRAVVTDVDGRKAWTQPVFVP